MEFTNFVGIDISKETFNVCLFQKGIKDHPEIQQQFSNNVSGFKKLVKWLYKSEAITLSNTLICMEYTGVYNRMLCKFLIERQACIWLEKPFHILRSIGMQRGKNDKVDARRIAEFARRNHDKAQLWQPARECVEKLKDLYALRLRLLKARHNLAVPVNELLKSGDKTAAELIQKACAASLKAIEKDLTRIEGQIKEIIEKDEKLLQLYRLITSVKGIGNIAAVTFICFTNEFSRLCDAKKLACYCGVAPFDHQSGKSINYKPRVSHLANKPLKKIIHLSAMAMVSHKGELQDYYKRKVMEGKSKMSVLNAVRNKLIHRVVAVVKRQTPFVETYTLNNERVSMQNYL